jgi:hypothetical protein
MNKRWADLPSLYLVFNNTDEAYRHAKNIMASNDGILKIRVSKAQYPEQGYYVDTWNLESKYEKTVFTEEPIKLK